MAQITIHGHDRKTNHAGVIKVLKDYCELTLNEALRAVDHAESNEIRSYNVAFVKRAELIEKLKHLGFMVT